MSKNSLLSMVIAFVLAVLVGLTILESTATSSVVQQVESNRFNERGMSAETARWEAIAKAQVAEQSMGNIIESPSRPRS